MIKIDKCNICIFLFFLMTLPLAGCNKSKELLIFPYVVFDCNHSKLAFLLAPVSDDKYSVFDYVESKHGTVCVLELMQNTGQIYKITELDEISLPPTWAWQPGIIDPTLFITADPEITMKIPPIKWFSVTFNKEGSSISDVGNITDNCIDRVSVLSWSPDGKVLAAALLSGIYLSFDEGKTFIDTNINIITSGKHIWKDNDTFYARGGGNLYEIKVSEQQAQIENIIATASEEDGGSFGLVGIINGDIVYLMGGSVYRKERLLFKSSKDKLYNAYCGGEFIVVQEHPDRSMSTFYVLNPEGEILKKRKINGDVVSIGLSPQKGELYIIRDMKKIQKFNFMENDSRITTIFDLDTAF